MLVDRPYAVNFFWNLGIIERSLKDEFVNNEQHIWYFNWQVEDVLPHLTITLTLGLLLKLILKTHQVNFANFKTFLILSIHWYRQRQFEF